MRKAILRNESKPFLEITARKSLSTSSLLLRVTDPATFMEGIYIQHRRALKSPSRNKSRYWISDSRYQCKKNGLSSRWWAANHNEMFTAIRAETGVSEEGNEQINWVLPHNRGMKTLVRTCPHQEIEYKSTELWGTQVERLHGEDAKTAGPCHKFQD